MTQARLTSELIDRLKNDIHEFKGTFSCGGAFKLPYLELFYKDKANASLRLLSFPCSEETLEPLRNLCVPATFGKGHETVLDMSYRNALQLDPEAFSLNFSPSYFGILEQVRRYMMPANIAIRDELYKLNIYGPGGHFKAHVDTPREGGMFGSLVVCLPVKFEGGQLLVKHLNTMNTFDWSSTQAYKDVQIQWAAFFSDCEHSILPVTSGYRLTLTYNLYAIDDDRSIGDSISGFGPESVAFHQTLATAMADPRFMKNGGILGFGMQHVYPIRENSDFPKTFDKILKGADAMIYVVAKKLGLTVSVFPVYSVDDDEESEENEDSEKDEMIQDSDMDNEEDQDKATKGTKTKNDKKLYVAGSDEFPSEGGDMCFNSDEESEMSIIKNYSSAEKRKDITWCIRPEDQVMSNTHFALGNDCYMSSMYVGAAMLVTIPRSAERGHK